MGLNRIRIPPSPLRLCPCRYGGSTKLGPMNTTGETVENPQFGAGKRPEPLSHLMEVLGKNRRERRHRRNMVVVTLRHSSPNPRMVLR